MWELNSKLQILNFFYAMVGGIIFDLFYDIFKAFRLKNKYSDIGIFIQDIIYFAVISVFTFCFFLVFTCGEIRFYILIGFGIGFFVSRLTISRIFVPFFSFIIGVIIKIRGYIRWLFDLIFEFFENIFKKVIVFLKNALKSVKKLLKKSEGLLYTNEE